MLFGPVVGFSLIHAPASSLMVPKAASSFLCFLRSLTMSEHLRTIPADAGYHFSFSSSHFAEQTKLTVSSGSKSASRNLTAI